MATARDDKPFTTAQLLDPENVFLDREMTVIEELAAAHQDALGGSYMKWSDLDAGHRRQHVVAMMTAIALLPDSSLYSLRQGEKQFVDLRGVRDGLIEEQAIRDERHYKRSSD